MASLDLFQLALSYHQAGNLDLAESLYQEILEQNPVDANALHLYGILSAQKGDYPLAEKLISQALTIDPFSSTFQNSMGNVLSHLNNDKKAIDHYEEALRLEPKSASAHNNLGNLYVKQGKLSAAKMHYQSAIRLKPDYTDAYYNLAIVLIKLGKNEEAVEKLEKTVTLEADFVEAHNQLAQLLQQNNQLDKALYHYTEVIALSPDQAEPYVNLGAILVKQGDLLQAIDYFNKAIEIEPLHHEAHYNLGATYLSLKKPDEALQHYLQCLSQHPDADTYFNIGVIYAYKDRYYDAIDHFNSALQIRPDFFDAHVNLATTYLKMECYENAISHYQRALEIHPKNAEIQYILSAITQQKNQPTQAPLSFIENLFDQYAPYFEKHLTETLKYQAHYLLYQYLLPYLKDKLRIADLGCGTGLCGTLFKPYAKELMGVDISSKMVEIAQDKHVYTALFVEDLVKFLHSQQEFDLILAADVFGYIGDLNEVFEATYDALKKEGYFAFTVEKGEQTECYRLEKSTRYVHSKNYIHQLCINYSFSIIKEDEVQLRFQRNAAVMGYLFILKK
jgi:predicted TPR repeat methyltransferase